MKRIFQFQVNDEKEFVAADDHLDAIKCYMSATDCDIDDISSLEEITGDNLDSFKVNYENVDLSMENLTFREYLEKANGNTTELFCSTIYD